MTRVLFLCVANACRSQMAEGFARALQLPDIEIHSAGSHPASRIHPSTVAMMQEAGIDISRAKPKGLAQLPRGPFDLVVSLCGDACPTTTARVHRSWNIPDPVTGSLTDFRRVRDLIRRRVEALMRELANDTPAPEPVPVPVPRRKEE